MTKGSEHRYRFRKHDRVGAADAEQDESFLSDCYVDSGDVAVLRDCRDARRIVLGRTGAGKTALLSRIAELEDHVVCISPEELSLTYLSDSTLLRYLAEIGVDLDLFYRLLWRHVFAIELIKERHRIRTEQDKKNFLISIYSKIAGDKKKESALDYLTEWGQHFWQETEYRVKEVTQKLETDIEASLEGKAPILRAAAKGRSSLSEEEKAEVVHRAQSVVNGIQIRELFEVMKLLQDDILDDPQYRVFILVDRLDERWIDDQLRYRIIRALIEAVREFTKVHNAKIIVALRRDLIDRVVRETRDTGFQEEKFTSLYLPLRWSKPALLQVLDLRINKLVRSKYTTQQVTHREILPDRVDGGSIGDYLIEMTMLRPRDIILYFNACIQQADGKAVFSKTLLKAAEVEHSRERLRSLADEWQSLYPEILNCASLLRKRSDRFVLSDIEASAIEEAALTIAVSESRETGNITRVARQFIEGKMGLEVLREYLVQVLYEVGLIGVKTQSFDAVSWSFAERATIPKAELDGDTRIYVHPVFHRVLGISTKRRD